MSRTQAKPKAIQSSDACENSIVTLAVDGYRGIREFELQGLAPITVFTGDNGAGKTRLLEAAFAVFGRKTLTWLTSLQASRGLRKVSAMGPNLLGIFDRYSDKGEARFRANTANGNRIEVALRRAEPQQLMMFAKNGPSSIDSNVLEPLIECSSFLNGEEEGKTRRLLWKVEASDRFSLEVENGEAGNPPGILLYPAHGTTQEDDAQRFGDAVASGMGERIFELLRIIDPRVQRIQYVPTSKGEFFGVQLDDNGLAPLGMLGGGVSNLFRYALCLNASPGGFLGIDEIENGFFHGRMSEVFRGLFLLRRETQTQLMLATHSKEALQALIHAAESISLEDLAVVHLRRDTGGTVHPTLFPGKDAASSIEHGYDLR